MFNLESASKLFQVTCI